MFNPPNIHAPSSKICGREHITSIPAQRRLGLPACNSSRPNFMHSKYQLSLCGTIHNQLIQLHGGDAPYSVPPSWVAMPGSESLENFDTFQIFPRIATELRLKIFCCTFLKGHKVDTVSYEFNKYPFESYNGHTDRSLPVTLHVNREIRQGNLDTATMCSLRMSAKRLLSVSTHQLTRLRLARGMMH